MRELIKRLGRTRWTLLLALAIVLISSQTAEAQFRPYRGWGRAYGYPAWGYRYPAWGYGGMGYGYPAWGYGGMGYGYPMYGFGYGYSYPRYGYYGMGFNPGFYAPGATNPLFGVGMTPLGVQSYMYETQVLGRRAFR